MDRFKWGMLTGFLAAAAGDLVVGEGWMALGHILAIVALFLFWSVVAPVRVRRRR
jgi:hypothetical protein